ncbi:MAG TPA: hypothetical protein VD838_10780, partial [Anaeromyxobacteraceae bacterium]|nr:hypothetical protein [Anaeromyxobacteraceae bacterium]
GAAAVPPRRVLLLDTCETVTPLRVWLRQDFLPGVDEELLVVMAGRTAPDPQWQADLGWQGAVRFIPLRNLTPEEGAVLLEKQGVPEETRPVALAFTRGYPLGLTLLAEHSRQHGGRPFVAAEAPDVVRVLLQRFLDDMPSPAHREALEGAALVRDVTEPVLGALLGPEAGGDPSALFAWLRGLSFIEEGPRGLFPHDLARDVLVADLRWRDVDRYRLLHERARRHYTALLQSVQTAAERHEVLGAYVYLIATTPSCSRSSSGSGRSGSRPAHATAARSGPRTPRSSEPWWRATRARRQPRSRSGGSPASRRASRSFATERASR